MSQCDIKGCTAHASSFHSKDGKRWQVCFAHRKQEPDVWDLTEKEGGDHVLIALTIEECEALVNCHAQAGAAGQHAALVRAITEVKNTLRDQKDIEHG